MMEATLTLTEYFKKNILNQIENHFWLIKVDYSFYPDQQDSVILNILYLNVIKNCAQQPLI